MGIVRSFMKAREAGADIATAGDWPSRSTATADQATGAPPAAIQEDLSTWTRRHRTPGTSARPARRQPVAPAAAVAPAANTLLQEATGGTAGKPDLAEWTRRHRTH